MDSINARSLGDITAELVVRANRFLPRDLYEGLVAAREREGSTTGKVVFDILLENAHHAALREVPICQDTGIDVVFLELAKGVAVTGNFIQEINRGIAAGTKAGLLRASVCHPVTRQNTKTNAPAVIHFDYSEHAEESRISILPKGCGSENMSALFMLPPSAGMDGVVEAVVAHVKKAGPNPCPPGIIGVGIGGTMEKAALMSKMALLRPLGHRNPEPELASLEEKIEQIINLEGAGPLGLGGDVSCLGVSIETFPCHIASLPVAINMQCHAARCATAVFRHGRWEIEDNLFDDISLSEKIEVKGRSLELPLSFADIASLSAGERVLLNGAIYTGRDQTHKMLVEILRQGERLPVDLKGALVYYTGPSPAPPGMVVGSAGPTTSYRMDAYTPALLEAGVVALMGKGRRSPEVRHAMKRSGAVYLATFGGAGAYLADRIVLNETVAFPELGPEAMFSMKLKNFPAVVINDCNGNDYYEEVAK